MMDIRFTEPRDIEGLQAVLDATELFPGDMLPDMTAPFLSVAPSDDIWLTCQIDDAACGFCYAVPEQLADGAWNMLAIAVDPSAQGSGAGSALVAALETELKARGQRIIVVDTSGGAGFKATRDFYAARGYDKEAVIRDFWADGDDKVIFRKSLR